MHRAWEALHKPPIRRARGVLIWGAQHNRNALGKGRRGTPQGSTAPDDRTAPYRTVPVACLGKVVIKAKVLGLMLHLAVNLLLAPLAVDAVALRLRGGEKGSTVGGEEAHTGGVKRLVTTHGRWSPGPPSLERGMKLLTH